MNVEGMIEGIAHILEGAAMVEGEGDWGGYSYTFRNPKFELNPYMWDYVHEEEGGECNCEGECPDTRPQFRHYATGLEISWYKYLGRGMGSNKSLTALEFYRDVVVDCLEALKNQYEAKGETT